MLENTIDNTCAYAVRIKLDEVDPSPYQAASPVVNPGGTTMRPVTLHPRERVLNMFRPQRRPRFWRG